MRRGSGERFRRPSTRGANTQRMIGSRAQPGSGILRQVAAERWRLLRPARTIMRGTGAGDGAQRHRRTSTYISDLASRLYRRNHWRTVSSLFAFLASGPRANLPEAEPRPAALSLRARRLIV